MRVLLVDDEPMALDRLEALLQEAPDVEIVGKIDDGDAAAELIPALALDLVFLDIRMPGRSGITIAKALAGQDSPEIVFVTAYDHFAAQAFELDAVDYLLKPVSGDRLALTLSRARRRRAAGAGPSLVHEPAEPAAESGRYVSSLWVRRRDGLTRVDVSTIDWIEAAGDYVILHTPTRSHILRTTMSGLHRRLDPRVMMRVSRSAIIRKAAVTAAERQPRAGLVLTLSGQTAVQVGMTYMREVGPAFHFFLVERNKAS